MQKKIHVKEINHISFVGHNMLDSYNLQYNQQNTQNNFLIS